MSGSNTALRVLHLNISDGGGGVGRAAYRLHDALVKRGIDSRMWVDFKKSEDPRVMGASRKLDLLWARIRTRLDKWPRLLCRHEHWEYASFNYLPNPRVCEVWKRHRPDVLHLHWVGDGLLPIRYWRHLKDIPTVVTLHGRWWFNGAQHLHSDQSKRFREGFVASNRDPLDGGLDVDRWVWERKRGALRDWPLTALTLSRWMERDAAASVLLGNKRIVRIPNGIDTSVFRPGERKELRTLLGLPTDRRLLLFGANLAVQDRNKGFADLVQALRLLEAQPDCPAFEVVVFGSERPLQELPFKTAAHFMGYIRDEATIARLYGACDAFVLPSAQDNLPNTVMEAMACGTPCVAFAVGGVPDMVDHLRNGYLASPRQVEDLSRGLAWVLSLDEQSHAALGKAAREKIEGEFCISLQVDRAIELYASMTSAAQDRVCN
jgi:glycosyltransferase involved in cell wall biosynthesis